MISVSFSLQHIFIYFLILKYDYATCEQRAIFNNDWCTSTENILGDQHRVTLFASEDKFQNNKKSVKISKEKFTEFEVTVNSMYDTV